MIIIVNRFLTVKEDFPSCTDCSSISGTGTGNKDFTA